ncbi:DUF308 domain-containing protein [Paenibacillus chitinolyticus]|uniref:DUF308 domain-containing protein n=1 Tax=Paenibacillus chitinolyticus TaxID=79263 RepID=UPI003CFDC463
MADERNKSTHPSNEQPLVTIKRKSDPAEEFSVHWGHSGHPASDSVRRSESFFPPDGMPPTIRKKRTSVVLSIVCGILAILLNLPVVTLPLGLILGVVSFGAGLAARRAHRRSAGLVLSLFSVLIAVVWLASALVPLAVDPTIRVGRLP